MVTNDWDNPPHFIHGQGNDSPAQRRTALQLILDEVHGMQREWEAHDDECYAAAGILNSSKVFGVTVSGIPMSHWT